MWLFLLRLLWYLEGLYAFFLWGAAWIGVQFLLDVQPGQELFGVHVTTEQVAVGMVLALLIAAWFTYRLIRGYNLGRKP